MDLEFPRMVYRRDPAKGSLPVPGVGLVACKGAADADAYAAALADGWAGSVPALMANVPAAPVEAPVSDGAPTRAEMLAQAEKLGIDVDKRWGDRRLMAAIETAMEVADG